MIEDEQGEIKDERIGSPIEFSHRPYSPPRRDAYDYRDSRQSTTRDRPPPQSRKPPPVVDDPTNVIGIFGMNSRTDENQLGDIFSQFGRVEKVVIVYDKITKQSRGFGFVTLDTIEGATRARDALNGKDIEGRQVRVDYSMSTEKPPRSSAAVAAPYRSEPPRDFYPPDEYARGRPPPRGGDPYYRDPYYRGGGDPYGGPPRYDDRYRHPSPPRRGYISRSPPRRFSSRSPPPRGRYGSPPPRGRYGSPPRDRFGSPPRGRMSPPRGRMSPPPRDRFGSPPMGRMSPPPRDRFGSPPRGRLSPPPPRDRFASPPRDRFASPPRERFASPPRDRFGSPPRERFASPLRERSQPPVRGRFGSESPPPEDGKSPIAGRYRY